MPKYLGIDAGGTSTRAVLLDSSGQCFGYGVAGGGNPVSRGFEPALQALAEASALALADTPGPLAGVLAAMAGASLELPTDLFRERFVTFGLVGDFLIESDLLAAFYSGSYQDDGCALIAGTGAVAARISGSQLAHVADGTGWLLGDAGAGFWLGREAAQAVAADLDGRGGTTALTQLVLEDLGINLDKDERTQGRLRAQQQLITKIYELKPIELSRFAPMVFAAETDPVARDILERAASALAGTLLTVSAPAASAAPLPLVFGGSVLTKGRSVAQAVMNKVTATASMPLEPPVLVEDGVVGAAVMVLKRHGIAVDAEVFARIRASLGALRP